MCQDIQDIQIKLSFLEPILSLLVWFSLNFPVWMRALTKKASWKESYFSEGLLWRFKYRSSSHERLPVEVMHNGKNRNAEIVTSQLNVNILRKGKVQVNGRLRSIYPRWPVILPAGFPNTLRDQLVRMFLFWTTFLYTPNSFFYWSQKKFNGL